MNKFTHITIQQVRDGNDYRYTILFDHQEVYTVINKKPQVFKNVDTYMGDRFYNPSNAIVRNFHFQNIE